MKFAGFFTSISFYATHKHNKERAKHKKFLSEDDEFKSLTAKIKNKQTDVNKPEYYLSIPIFCYFTFTQHFRGEFLLHCIYLMVKISLLRLNWARQYS